ncbi:MAG: hypothetical protein BWX64_00215 [Acidobacteria bacterium ADurb.Bin051]|nr:MAG: hypothetical protein BWX64_00215 [Acidobacteria bacterium ADurb.Bin051]
MLPLLSQPGERPEQHFDPLAQPQAADEEERTGEQLLVAAGGWRFAGQRSGRVRHHGDPFRGVIPLQLRSGPPARREDPVGEERAEQPEGDLHRRLQPAKPLLHPSRTAEDEVPPAQRSHRPPLLHVTHLEQRHQPGYGVEERGQDAHEQRGEGAIGLVDLHHLRPEPAQPAPEREQHGQREEELRAARSPFAPAEDLDLVPPGPEPGGELQDLFTDPGKVGGRQGVRHQEDAHSQPPASLPSRCARWGSTRARRGSSSGSAHRPASSAASVRARSSQA